MSDIRQTFPDAPRGATMSHAGDPTTQAGVPAMPDVQQPGTPGPQAPQQAAGRPNAARMPNRMPKAQAQRIASGLKKGVLVASVALFSGFAALVAGNIVGATASS